jgi:8-oxo-dGTP pyrophosphatase MutT (NUDIX family)
MAHFQQRIMERHAPLAPNSLLYRGNEQTVLAGMIPYDTSGKEPRFLIQRPRPKRNTEDVLPFGLCRGHMQESALVGNHTIIHKDLGRAWPPIPDHAESLIQMENPASAAKREAEEELGIGEKDFTNLQYLGEIAYRSFENPKPRGVHFFIAKISPLCPALTSEAWRENFAARHPDTAELRWVTLAEARDLVKQGEMKDGYLPVLEAISNHLSEQKAKGSRA